MVHNPVLKHLGQKASPTHLVFFLFFLEGSPSLSLSHIPSILSYIKEKKKVKDSGNLAGLTRATSDSLKVTIWL